MALPQPYPFPQHKKSTEPRRCNHTELCLLSRTNFRSLRLWNSMPTWPQIFQGLLPHNSVPLSVNWTVGVCSPRPKGWPRGSFGRGCGQSLDMWPGMYTHMYTMFFTTWDKAGGGGVGEKRDSFSRFRVPAQNSRIFNSNLVFQVCRQIYFPG